MVINRPVANHLAGHLLQTQRLGGELNLIMQLGPLEAVLVLHRINPPIGVKLHHIALANQPQTIRPHRQRPLRAHALEGFHPGFIHPLMGRIPAHGMHIVRKRLLQMNQRTLTRAIAPVLEGGQHDEIGGGHGGLKPLNDFWSQARQFGQLEAAVSLNAVLQGAMHLGGRILP